MTNHGSLKDVQEAKETKEAKEAKESTDTKHISANHKTCKCFFCFLAYFVGQIFFFCFYTQNLCTRNSAHHFFYSSFSFSCFLFFTLATYEIAIRDKFLRINSVKVSGFFTTGYLFYLPFTYFFSPSVPCSVDFGGEVISL